MYESKTVAQTYALAIGLLLLAAGIVGFVLLPTEVDKALDLDKSILEPSHSGLYIFAGLLGLATWRRANSSRIYAMTIGAVYLLLAAWGLAAASVPIGTPVSALPEPQLAGDVFHAVIGVAGVAIGLTSPRHGRYPVPADAS